MFVAAALVELHIPGSTSLKDKRRVVRSLIDAARRRFGVAVSEVGSQDSQRTAEIGFTAVSESRALALKAVEAAVGLAEEHPEAQVVRIAQDELVVE